MTSYAGRHAHLYDLFYARKPYAEEADFIHSCVGLFSEGAARRMLELGCGTGGHALALEPLGYEIVATDLSGDMLAEARRKAGEQGSRVEFRRQDMRALDVPEWPFDVAICLFDAIGYVVTNDGLERVLEGVFRHLRPGGLFLFEFWHAAAMLRLAEPVRLRRIHTANGSVLRVSVTTLDCRHQTGRVRYSLYEHRRDGTFSHLEEEQVNLY